MQTTQEVIYQAANLEQANLLKNLLKDQGIEAHVTNSALQQAAGTLPYGGPIEPRLVVDASNAAEARRIAIEFEQVVAERRTLAQSGLRFVALAAIKLAVAAFVWSFVYGIASILAQGLGLDIVAKVAAWGGFIASAFYLFWLSAKHEKSAARRGAAAEMVETDDEPNTPTAPWPTCPDCSRRRLTSCPVCETAGTGFPRAFMPERRDEGGVSSPENLFVLCTICDEPFVPEFPAHCEWCGHRFADGRELPPRQASELEMDSRAWIVIVGLVAVLAAMAMSFLYIARG
jgi:hypothetical protein